MTLEVYYPQDILRALLAAEQATGAALQVAMDEDPYIAGYLVGYRAALVTIALAFGLARPDGKSSEQLSSLSKRSMDLKERSSP